MQKPDQAQSIVEVRGNAGVEKFQCIIAMQKPQGDGHPAES
jgi:hypothetical protein